MSIGAVVLHKILDSQSLDAWARVRLSYFPPEYTSLFSVIHKYYNRYNTLPSFEQLITTLREGPLLNSVLALQSIEVPDIDISIAVDALIDQFAQDETIKYLDGFIEKLPILDVSEIKESLSEMVLNLDEKTLSSDRVITASDICLFEKPEDIGHSRFPLGINNTFDSVIGGAYREELVLMGGKRGAGKSVVCSNLVTAQYERDYVSVYFTIEMRAAEVFQRNCAILAGVPHVSIRQNSMTESDIKKLAKVRADMFEDADSLYEEFLQHGDRFAFEHKLRQCKVRTDRQIIIVDDRELSISTIDLHLQKLKAQYKDKLNLVVVDYLNQIIFPGSREGMYDWKVQIEISKQLKNLARKYDVCMVSPMQIDDDNGIRYAKGILDAPDIAFIIDANEKSDNCISFDTTKIRGGPPLSFSSGIDWNTLRISPMDIPAPKKIKKSAEKPTTTKTVERDLPW